MDIKNPSFYTVNYNDLYREWNKRTKKKRIEMN